MISVFQIHYSQKQHKSKIGFGSVLRFLLFLKAMLVSNFSGFEYEAGCDEAGRGCLAGPVFAAAVMFPKNYYNKEIRDSKQISPEKRAELCKLIKKEALCYHISISSPAVIDKVNVLNASIQAMHKAIKKLSITPQYIIVDGNRFHPIKGLEFSCIIKGDDKYLSIAAASILAKVHRDNYMKRLSRKHPGYGWERNKGYPTLEHRKAIYNLGSTNVHRKSFKLLKADQLKLFSPK